jgi:hypothetical protein
MAIRALWQRLLQRTPAKQPAIMHVSSAEAEEIINEITAQGLLRRGEPLTVGDLLQLVRSRTHADSPAEFEVQVREHADGALLGFLALGVTYANEQERRTNTLWVSGSPGPAVPPLGADTGASRLLSPRARKLSVDTTEMGISLGIFGRPAWKVRWTRDAATGAVQRPSNDALRRINSGDLVSESELRAALRAAYERATPGEGRTVQEAQRLGHTEDSRDQEQSGPLSTEEAQLVAGAAANTINHTLARLFLRLGPPPEGASGDVMPVSSGGGGAQQ